MSGANQPLRIGAATDAAAHQQHSIHLRVGLIEPLAAPPVNNGRWLVVTQGELVSLTDIVNTTSTQGRLVFDLFASLAKFKRELIRERTHAKRLRISKATSYKYLRHRNVVTHTHRKPTAGKPTGELYKPNPQSRITPQGWRMLQHLPPRDGRLKGFGVRLAHRNHGVA